MIVIDTSVALKWLLTLDEKAASEARFLLNRHIESKEKILVPDLLFYETANALTTKTRLPQLRVKELIKKFYTFNLSIYHPDDIDVLETTSLARKHKTSVYDMLYAVVAKKHKTTLITADEKFVEKTGFRHVVHIKSIKLENNDN